MLAFPDTTGAYHRPGNFFFVTSADPEAERLHLQSATAKAFIDIVVASALAIFGPRLDDGLDRLPALNDW